MGGRGVSQIVRNLGPRHFPRISNTLTWRRLSDSSMHGGEFEL